MEINNASSPYSQLNKPAYCPAFDKKKHNYDKLEKQKAIYKHNSYGPTFGGQHDLYLSNSSKSTTGNYCYVGGSSAYNTGDKNLLGNPGQTTFQVSHYEVYQVIFE